MLTLEGAGLAVSVLDPRADLARLGSRYCSGGYVWQVTDATHGELFAGPHYPSAEPPPFDGQGAPDVFELALDQDRTPVGGDVYVLGVGRVRRESPIRPFHVRDNPTVTERAEWELSVTATTLRARTHTDFRGFACELVRSLELVDRTLCSTTSVVNSGERTLPLRWFSHPFLPWAGERVCRLSLESALPPRVALGEDDAGFLVRRPGIAWDGGQYLLPRVALGGELTVEHCHPKIGVLRARYAFPLGGLALWGNARTFSAEAFFQTLVPPGAHVSWGVEYSF